mmetsp:Transcript_3347/g.7306  ORF Transcript_3347/g.7306 Transcript_3347/m.7306 type:complete len:209 (-) Transcript_3347:467-1093(-)
MSQQSAVAVRQCSVLLQRSVQQRQPEHLPSHSSGFCRHHLLGLSHSLGHRPQHMGQQSRLVAAGSRPAGLDAPRCEVGGICLNHQTVMWDGGQQGCKLRTASLRPVITHPARDADVQVQLQEALQLLPAAREAVNNGGDTQRCVAAQDLGKLAPRVTTVHEQGLPDLLRKRHLHVKPLLLHSWRAEVPVEVETTLSNRHTAWVCGEGL